MVTSLLYIDQNKLRTVDKVDTMYVLAVEKMQYDMWIPCYLYVCWFSAIDFFFVALRKTAKFEIRGTKHISQVKFQLLPCGILVPNTES